LTKSCKVLPPLFWYVPSWIPRYKNIHQPGKHDTFEVLHWLITGIDRMEGLCERDHKRTPTPTHTSHTHPNRTSHYNVCPLITANAAQDWAMVINDNWGHVCRFADTIWRTINRPPNFLHNIMSTTWRPIVLVTTYTHTCSACT